MADQQQGERSVFLAAIEIESADRRKVYLDEACGDDRQLRADVEALLREHETSQGLLDAPDRVVPTLNEPFAERPGMTIGPYKLLEEIGEGGMGLVFMAEQREPISRRVALKIIRPGMDTREVIARFEAERQALALMDHPSIARVLDAGATDSGRPYFVMELVNGIPLIDYCDQNRLDTRERLRLFVSTCQAVQHAHQKGIIHRDIKPSHVMITLHDGVPVPKVIDFGIAKAVDHRLTDKTSFTRFGQMIGTPLYMSPEQAERSGLDIDTRSDIYSLGVLLYELLTGTTPFERERFAEAGYDEMCSIIREEEPSRPSEKITTVGEAAATISSHRNTDPAKLGHLLRGELDWIVMKSLEKDRTRRYETANGFAADIRRYLNDDPVEACPPSTAYRLGKLYRRNKPLIGTITAVGIALLLGAGLALTQAAESRRQRDLANAAAESEQQQRVEADKQREEAERQKQIAQENFERARDSVDEYLTRVSQEHLLDQPGLQPLRKDLLGLALKYYQEFAEERSDDAGLQADLADAYYRIAGITYSIGSIEEAIEACRKSFEIYKKLVSESPAVPGHQHSLVSSSSRLAGLYTRTRRGNEAVTLYQDSIRILEELVGQNPAVSKHRHHLAQIYNDFGALQCDLAKQHDQAATLFRRAIDLREELVAENPGDPQYLRSLPMNYMNLGIQHKNLGNPEEAAALYQKAINTLDSLVADNPEDLQFQNMLAEVHSVVGFLQMNAGKLDEAANAFHRAIGFYRELAIENPAVHRYRHGLALGYECLGSLQRKMRKDDEAVVYYRGAIELRKELVNENSIVPDYRYRLLKSYFNLGSLQRKTGKHEDAAATYRDLVQLVTAIPEQDQSVADWGYLGQGLFHLERWAEARNAMETSIRLRGETEPTIKLGPRWWYLTMALARLGEMDKARSYYDKLAAELEAKEKPSKTNQQYRRDAAEVLGIVIEMPGETGTDSDEESSSQEEHSAEPDGQVTAPSGSEDTSPEP